MEWTLLSPKQLDFISRSTAFINVADGPVRSGKTVACLIRWGLFVKQAPRGDLMMLGKTERTLKRNVIGPLQDIWGAKRARYIQGAGELYLFGRRIYLVGANDERAEEKIRGATLAGAYCNELSLFPKSAFDQLLARCSIPGAQVFADTNPDSPYHWLHQDYLANEALLRSGDLRRWQFRLDDNFSLSRQYKERLKRLYTGLWFKRMILGLWVMAEGAIYDQDPETYTVDDLPRQFERYVIGIDYGTANPTVFLLLGQAGQKWYVIREYYFDSRATGRQKTDADYSRDLRSFLDKIHPQTIEVDPSAASFIAQLRRDGLTRVHGADHDVLDGIRAVARALANGELLIHRSCKNLLSELTTYSWDPKAQKKGEDKPLKEHDHAPDALRYAAMRIFGRPQLRVVSKPKGW